MPSERVQHAYGLIQKTLQQSGIIHNSGSQQTGSASNPYGYSNVPQQQTSWQQAGPPPPPPSVPGYGPNAYVSVPGRPPAGPGPPAPPLMTPTQVTYSSPPIPPPYRPLQSQSQQGWMPTIQSNVTAATTTNPHNPTQDAQQQGFSSIFPPPPPPPKPHQYSAQPPPLPPRPGTQDPPPNQTSSWPRPPMQTTQSVPSFQDSLQTAHPIYRKYGHLIQDNGGAPSYGFTSSNVSHGQSFGTTQQPSQPSYQSTQSPVPQQSAWQAPTAQQPDVSPIQQHAQPYAATHTPVNQSAGPPPHIFQSPATHTPPTVPSVSPPPYNYAFPPPPPGEPPQFDYFERSENSTKSQAQFQRPSSHGNNQYDPPVSPPIPHVSPLVSRQGSLASQPGRSNERQDTVSSVSTAPMHERHDTVSSISTAAVDRPVAPKVETSGAVDLQSGAAVTAGSAAGTSASALGFGGPGGWEYYAPLEGDSEDDAGDVGKGKAKEEAKEEDREPISPVELPSEPIVTKEDVGVQKKEEQDMEEEGIYELPADFSMAETVKPADPENRGTEQDVSETTDLPKPSTRYNRIPRPQDLIPDLGPWYASSLERYISMLKQEAYSISDEQRAAAFVEFVAVESRVRGIPYYTQPPAQNQEQTTDELQRKPKLPLEIPAVDMNNAATEDMQYSPGGRPILRAKAPDRRNTAEEAKTAIVRDDQRPYKPFRQNTFPADSEASSQPAVSTSTSNEPENTGQSASAASQKQSQYKPYTPGTPTVETIRRESFPHRSSISSPTGTPTAGKHEHGETFFPAPLALRAKKDRTSTPPASTSTAPPRSAEEDKLSTPSAVPYPATPSQTPPPPEPPAASTKPSSTPPSSETGIARLAALLAKPLPTTPAPDTARIRQTLSALPSLDATRAHTTALRAAFDATTAPSEVCGAAAAQAKTLFAALASERADTQTLNDMAFEANELTYPELLARDDALKRREVERVAGEAERVGREEGRAYGRWEGEVFAGVYGRVRQEVDGGVEGLAVVEDVGAGAVGVLSSGEENGKEESVAPAASGLVKINARTGEVMVVEGLAQGGGAAAPSTAPPPLSTTKKQAKHTAVETTLTALRTLNESTRALLNLHAHISARHVLLAETVAERDARYARAQVAPLEFLVAFDDLENPAAAGAAATKNSQSDGAEQRSPDDDDTRTKLRDLKRHFASARLGAAARAAADEEVRARQTWQRVEGWMAAGVAAVARTVGEIMDAVAEVERVVGSGEERSSEVRELLDRAEGGVKDLSGGAEGLVRAFYDVEVLLNEAEFAVSVEEARVAVFEKAGGAGKGERLEKEAESVIGKLEAEKGKEDGVLKEELEGRLRKLGEEQKDKGIRAVRKARAKVVGREEFGDEDRIVGWAT